MRAPVKVDAMTTAPVPIRYVVSGFSRTRTLSPSPQTG